MGYRSSAKMVVGAPSVDLAPKTDRDEGTSESPAPNPINRRKSDRLNLCANGDTSSSTSFFVYLYSCAVVEGPGSLGGEMRGQRPASTLF